MILPLIAYTLIWKPRLGEVSKQQLRFELHFEDEDILYTADLTTKVEEVGSDGTYTLANSSANSKMILGSKELPDDDTKVNRERYDNGGHRLDIDDFGDPYSNLMGTLTEFYPPPTAVEFGATWTHQLSKDPSTGEPLSFMDYKLVGEEGGRLRIDFTYKQLFAAQEPVTANGKFWLDRTTFGLLAYEATAENVRENPEDAPGTIVISLKTAR